MKFSTYTPAVKPNTINARVNTSVIKEAFGDGGANLGAWGAAAKQIAGVVIKKQDEDDAADIMAARNEISQKVNAGLYGENGIITTGKGKNAVGMTDRINQLINDSTNEVAENYNGRVRYQLQNKYMPQDLEQFGKLGMQTENRERDAYQTDVFNARMETLGNDAAMAYADPETAYAHIGEAEETLNSWAEKQGWDPMTLQNKQMENRTRMVASMVKAAATDGKFDVAGKYLERERKNMDADTYSQLHASIDKQQKAKQTKDYSRSILEQCYNSQTNEIDVEKAQKMAREYSTAKGSGNISGESVERGYQKWAGQRMPNGANGCVEAAVRILGTDSNNPWIQSIQGDTYVPTLVSKAQSENGGPGVVQFSADQVEPGDMIIYGDNDHVVVATGGTGYVGNSSSRMQVVKGSDYNEMGGQVPTYIIKSSHLGDSVGSFDADAYDAIMSEVYSGYADQAKFWTIDNKQKVRDLENQLAGMESFGDMRAAVANSGLDAKTQADFNRKIATAEKQAIRAASSGSGSSGGGGMTSQQRAANRYFDSLTEEEDLSLIEEYNDRMNDPDDTISAADQKRYNRAARRYNFYHGTGTADLNNKEVLDAINEYKNQGYTYTQIWEGLGDSMSDESKEYYLRAAFGG